MCYFADVTIYLKDLLLFSLNRQQDVRATEIDKVDMYLSFRPGDIVRALVVSFMLCMRTTGIVLMETVKQFPTFCKIIKIS